MDLSTGQRVKEYIKLRGISQEKLRISIGVTSASQLSRFINGKESIPEKHMIEMIIKYCDINARWLLTGVGSMLNEEEKGLEDESHEPTQPYKNCVMCEEKDIRIKDLKDHIESLKKILDSQLNVSVKNDTAHCG